MAYIRPLEIILAEKKTELVLLFHKNITLLVFLWPNMGQKYFKLLIPKNSYYKSDGKAPANSYSHVSVIFIPENIRPLSHY